MKRNYDEVRQKCLAFIKGQLNVNSYTLFPTLRENYELTHTGRVYGSVSMPSDAVVDFPNYIYCDQFYDETYQGVCSGRWQNINESARVNLGVEISTHTDKKYTSAICPLRSDGTWKSETFTRTTEIYGINGEVTQKITYWSRSDKTINDSASNGVKGFTLKYYRWVDDNNNPIDIENLPPTIKEGTSVSGQTLMKTETYTLKPILLDDEEVDDAMPHYPNYVAELHTLADVEYLSGTAQILYDDKVLPSDLPPNPPVLPDAPTPFIRDVIFLPSKSTNLLEVAWISNFDTSCTIQINNRVYTVNPQRITDGYATYKVTITAEIGKSYDYTVNGNGVTVTGNIEYPSSNIYRICGDPQIIDELSAQRWYTGQNVPSPFNGKPTLLLSMGDQIDSITSNKLKRVQYSMFARNQKIPVMVTRGNHDKPVSFLAQYSMPNANGGDYYFIHQDTLFVVIDTTHADYDKHKAIIEQGLNSGSYSASILIMHHGMYTVGNNAYADIVIKLRNNLLEFVESKPFNMVLSGHDHIYCRNTKSNKLFMVAPSCTASKLYKVTNSNAPWAEVYMEMDAPTLIDMRVNTDTIDFVVFDHDGNILDEFTINK